MTPEITKEDLEIAVLRERERCAKIAEQWGTGANLNDEAVANLIATKIREG